MSLDFFNVDCRYSPNSEDTFGLCDKQDGSRAYPNTDNFNAWIATVKNKRNLPVVFTAIDKCVLQDHELKGEGRCDGMLTTEELLYLVELKDKEPPWQNEALEQLKSTIRLLMGVHDIAQYRKRKAFACNKKRDKFIVIDNEFNKRFFRETTFRIDFQTEILVV
jgi:hypothetical protein